MSKEFIIVIEADNKRAAAAYRKGLEDLELVMPQLMKVAQERDDAAQAAYDAHLAERLEEWHAKAPVLELDGCGTSAQKQRARNEWEYKTLMHGFDKPGSLDWNCGNRRIHVPRLESIRAELKRMADIAEMATGPYRMTEHQVAELIGWESGYRVERLKHEYA